jgi:uncharacterized lipoprotein YehR (DUF1307 family)
MLKRFITTLFLALCLVSFTACSSDKETSSKSVAAEGNWSEPSFDASVHDHKIEIWLVGDEARSLYWAGTFPADTLTNGDKIPSKADVERLNASLTGVGETAYTFTYDDDSIQFEFIFGETSRIVHLEKE